MRHLNLYCLHCGDTPQSNRPLAAFLPVLLCLFSFTPPALALHPSSSQGRLPPSSLSSVPPTLRNTQIIPGERIGPVTKTTTYTELERSIGKQFLNNRTISGPEGIEQLAATRVTLRQNQSFTIVWADNTRTRPLHVRDLGTAWKTSEGIGVGTNFNQLRQLAGEFRVTGLGWDYGGLVLLENTRLAHYVGKILLTVDAAPNSPQRFQSDYRAVSGDSIFSSTNPHWQPLNMRVTQMTVVLSRP